MQNSLYLRYTSSVVSSFSTSGFSTCLSPLLPIRFPQSEKRPKRVHSARKSASDRSSISVFLTINCSLIPTFDEHDDGWPIASATNTPVGNSLLQFYEYTSYVWTLLALVSLGFQASRTSTSSPSYIKLLSEFTIYK